MNGVDVSHYQTSAKVAASVKAGAKFVIVKATDGMTSTDSSHGLHVATAHAGGALVGHYHFARDVYEAPAEASHFLATASPKPGEATALDIESMNGDWSQRLAYALQWLKLVKVRTFARPLVYMNKSWLAALTKAATPAQRAELASYPLWIATGGVVAGQPGVNGWAMHQYSTAGGIDHDVLAPGVQWADFAIPLEKPNLPTKPSLPKKGHKMFLFTYTIPGHSAAWFITDGVNYYRWVSSADKAAYVGAGVQTITHPSYIATMTLAGPTPP